jgi:replicative DNA helicase
MTAPTIPDRSSPGPRILARLLCGLPTQEPDTDALPEPWRDLARVVRAAPPRGRVAALKSALGRRPDAAAITAAIFAVDPAEVTGRQPRVTSHRTFDSQPSTRDSAWEPPIPFGDRHLPPFPTEALPPWLGDFVRAEATATQTPLDLAGLLALAVLSAVCAGRVVVRPWGDWHEPVNLYTMVVLPPGHRKSAVFASATRPLQEFEAGAARLLGPAVARAESVRKVAEQALHKAEDAAARAPADDRPARLAVVERLAAELAALAVPPCPRLIVDDCSPERLATLLHEQGGRIAVMSPEGGIFDLMAGRYSTTGAPNFEHFLKGHAGDPIIVDRVGRPSELIPRPAITMGLAVQPVVLRGLMARPGFHGRGLLARFLYALPGSPIGRRAVDPPPVPEEVRVTYHVHVKTLLDRLPPPGPQHHPPVLVLSEPAAARLKRFAHDLEPRLAEFGDLERLVDWASKLVGLIARLAALLHLAHHAHAAGMQQAAPPPVEEETMAAAVALGEYATDHARAAYAAMGADPALDDARYLLRWIERADIASFSGRELYRATRGRFRQVDELAPALAALERHGYVRRRPSWARPGPGRKPGPIYDVNPHARAPRPDRPSGAQPASRAADSGHSDHSVQGGLTPAGDLSATHDDELPR